MSAGVTALFKRTIDDALPIFEAVTRGAATAAVQMAPPAPDTGSGVASPSDDILQKLRDSVQVPPPPATPKVAKARKAPVVKTAPKVSSSVPAKRAREIDLGSDDSIDVDVDDDDDDDEEILRQLKDFIASDDSDDECAPPPRHRHCVSSDDDDAAAAVALSAALDSENGGCGGSAPDDDDDDVCVDPLDAFAFVHTFNALLMGKRLSGTRFVDDADDIARADTYTPYSDYLRAFGASQSDEDMPYADVMYVQCADDFLRDHEERLEHLCARSVHVASIARYFRGAVHWRTTAVRGAFSTCELTLGAAAVSSTTHQQQQRRRQQQRQPLYNTFDCQPVVRYIDVPTHILTRRSLVDAVVFAFNVVAALRAQVYEHCVRALSKQQHVRNTWELLDRVVNAPKGPLDVFKSTYIDSMYLLEREK